MTPAKAMTLLGLPSNDLSEQAVKAAFARRVKEVHPDIASAPSFCTSVSDLKEARDLLLDGMTLQNSACTLCRGDGKVRGIMGWHKCSACNGTGDRYGQS